MSIQEASRRGISGAFMPMVIAWILIIGGVLLLNGCVSFDAGIAKVGLDVNRFRFADGGIEADVTAYARLTPIKSVKALLNIDNGILTETLPSAGDGRGEAAP